MKKFLVLIIMFIAPYMTQNLYAQNGLEEDPMPPVYTNSANQNTNTEGQKVIVNVNSGKKDGSEAPKKCNDKYLADKPENVALVMSRPGGEMSVPVIVLDHRTCKRKIIVGHAVSQDLFQIQDKLLQRPAVFVTYNDLTYEVYGPVLL